MCVCSICAMICVYMQVCVCFPSAHVHRTASLQAHFRASATVIRQRINTHPWPYPPAVHLRYPKMLKSDLSPTL